MSHLIIIISSAVIPSHEAHNGGTAFLQICLLVCIIYTTEAVFF